MEGPSHNMLSTSRVGDDDTSPLQLEQWIKEQEILKVRLVLRDDFSWSLPRDPSSGIVTSDSDSFLAKGGSQLRYVGGVDISFSKNDASVALGALVVLELDTLQVVYEDFDLVRLTMPYIPGFLGFRESPVFLGLLEKMTSKAKPLYPQLLMVDGNGILHPRGFGLASQLGVLADIPTIGVGKNLHHVDGISDAEVRLRASKSNINVGESVPLVGRSGQIWGAALKSHERSSKPIFISVGHRISLETAIAVVQRCCHHRIPEPVRQADIRSRERLRLTSETNHVC